MTTVLERLNGAPPKLTSGEVLDAYGRRGSTQETKAMAIEPSTDEIIHASAEKMIEDTMAALFAAEDILATLRGDTETFISEVRHHSGNLAARMASYVQCCKNAGDAMQQHRESVLKVAATIAEQPASIAEHEERAEAQQ